ncbi:hypothetical protein D3C87_1577230 [compost metagenome]
MAVVLLLLLPSSPLCMMPPPMMPVTRYSLPSTFSMRSCDMSGTLEHSNLRSMFWRLPVTVTLTSSTPPFGYWVGLGKSRGL